jgi:aspartate racemase
MKILGLIGGISWVSTVDYYTLINRGINDRLGGLNFSQCIIYSFNYADIKMNNDNNDWDATFNMIANACHHLKTSGAQGIVLCANTMHYIADKLEKEIGLPVIHIATVTADEIEKQRVKKVGLLGTKFTMELDFFRSKLTARGIDVLIPGDADREFIHQTIFDELGKGIVTDKTRHRYLQVANKLIEQGAEGIVLGCTEIPLVIKPGDLPVTVFDTTLLHSRAAIEFSLSER